MATRFKKHALARHRKHRRRDCHGVLQAHTSSLGIDRFGRLVLSDAQIALALAFPHAIIAVDGERVIGQVGVIHAIA